MLMNLIAFHTTVIVLNVCWEENLTLFSAYKSSMIMV